MKCKEILERLEEDYPVSCAESWDNSGFLAGEEDSEVTSVMVSLDATDEVIAQAVESGVQLLITHHPMIFGGIKQVSNRSLTGRRLLKLIQNGISCYAMHTNFDIRGMAELNEKQLGLRETRVLYTTGEENGIPEGIGRVGYLQEEMRYTALAEFVKTALPAAHVRCYGSGDPVVKHVAVSGGSGKSVVASALAAGAEVLVTGDIDYHTGIDAAAEGLRIIDAGHFGTEQVFMPYMTQKLQRLFPSLKVLCADQKPPFVII